MVWRRHILSKLHEMGIGGNMCHFVKNFINNRNIQVRFNNSLSQKTLIENGVSQVSVLNVALFLIPINDACCITKPPVITRVLADDITILCKGKSINTTQQLIQQALNKLHNWPPYPPIQLSTKTTSLGINEIQTTNCTTLPSTTEFKYTSTNFNSSYRPWKKTDPIKYLLSLTKNKKDELNVNEWKELFSTLCKVYTNFTHVYTDGSKDKMGRTGATVVMQNKTAKYGLNPINSIHTAEAYALLSALNLIDSSPEPKFIIFSDSLSSIVKIQNTKQTTEIYTEIHETYYQLVKSNKTITIAWIPSHKDIFGNEMADLETKIASTQQQPTDTQHVRRYQ
ncbi:uncharacterized protein LOC122403190 [Colletes gigas]|uniref:uncharacterized protein LOC122403190 n=1 Tax=Colletes gigas TaxID=935657 RepID=UPI001C9B4E7E|nr:uncharacterized protein LOC122403190 [Colletes gigas]